MLNSIKYILDSEDKLIRDVTFNGKAVGTIEKNEDLRAGMYGCYAVRLSSVKAKYFSTLKESKAFVDESIQRRLA